MIGVPRSQEYCLILPILSTTKSTFLVEIQKAVLSL